MRIYKKSKAAGFTLVELLVVIAIIALLMSLLIPQIRKGITRAKFAKCKHNLHIIGVGITAFADAHDEVLPGVDDAVGTAGYEQEWLGKEVFYGGYSGGGDWTPDAAGSIPKHMNIAGGQRITSHQGRYERIS